MLAAFGYLPVGIMAAIGRVDGFDGLASGFGAITYIDIFYGVTGRV